MARSLQFVNVIDVESSCWDGQPPIGEQSEIIQIGITVLDLKSLLPTTVKSVFVKPRMSTVSAFCTQLTGITQDQVDEGMDFADACRYLVGSFSSKQVPWASYGDYDRHMFENLCRFWEIPYPFGSRHLNVKTLLGLAENLPAEIGMDKALEHLRLAPAGRHHDAGDDAHNIARILGLVLHRARTGG